MRVLVVDDAESITFALRAAFEEAGFEVETARSVPGAIARIQSRAPDAVLVDKNMPGESGVELVRYLQEHNPTVAVLMMTAYTSPGSEQEVRSHGADAYLQKPFRTLQSVVDAVTSVVKKRQGTGS